MFVLLESAPGGIPSQDRYGQIHLEELVQVLSIGNYNQMGVVAFRESLFLVAFQS